MLDPKADSLGVGVVRYEGGDLLLFICRNVRHHQSIRIIPQRGSLPAALGGFFL